MLLQITVLDFWVNLMHERIQYKTVQAHLQLAAPHGLLADLIRHYLGNTSLYPEGVDFNEKLPEFLIKVDCPAPVNNDNITRRTNPTAASLGKFEPFDTERGFILMFYSTAIEPGVDTTSQSMHPDPTEDRVTDNIAPVNG